MGSLQRNPTDLRGIPVQSGLGKKRRVVAKIEWPPGELMIGFMQHEKETGRCGVYNKRGTAEQYIKEGKLTFNWTRLSCKRFWTTRHGCSCTHWPTI